MKMKKKKVMQWQKSLTTAWHKDNSEVLNLAMQKIENHFQHPHRLLCSKAEKKSILYKSRKYILPSLVLSEWPTGVCLDFSTWRNYRSVRAWVQVMELFPHVFLQAYSVANVTQLKARGRWIILINHLFSVRWKTCKLTNSFPEERGGLAKDDLHKQDH